MSGGRYSNIRDMLDGGGAGMSGPEFEGGALSPLLNQLGIKPMGYNARMQQPAQPVMATQGAPRPPMGVPAPSPVSVTPLNASGMPVDPATPQMPQPFVGFDGARSPMMQQIDPITQYYMMIEAQQRGRR